MTDFSGIASCLAEQLRLLGYVVLAPPATAPTSVDTAPVAPTDVAPVPLQKSVQEAQGAAAPPATCDFAAYRDLFNKCRAHLGMPQED